MDDLVGGLLVLTLAAVAIAIAIAVAMAMVVAGAGVGASIALVQGSAAFLADFGASLRTRGGSRRAPLPPEPAYELYVLGQLQRDLRHALETGWGALNRFRGSCAVFADRYGEGWTMPLAIGAVIGGFAGTAIAAVAGVLVSIPIVALTLLGTGGAWLLVGALRLAERIRRRVRRASYECPVDHERFPLPVYVCPACGAEHRRLVPGRWGILRRECACRSTSLPTMVLNGRQRVPQRCPSGHPMSGLIGFAGRIGVPIVAGPRAGKTSYLAAAMLEFEQIAEDGRLAVHVVDESRHAYDLAVSGLRSGVLPPKTGLGGNPALVTEIEGSGRSRVLYAYDVAGESYSSSDEVRELRFLEVPSGLLLLVDPLSLPDVAGEHAAALARDEDAVRPSPEFPMRTLERTVAALAEAGFETRKVPLAVVISKVDAFGLEAEFEALRATHSERAPRAWLEAHGAGNLVRAVEQDFRDVGWFATTALGRLPRAGDVRPFTPRGAAAPLLWILERNGVAPAKRAFSASKDAARLRSAGAADFPPISRLGWSVRIAAAAIPVTAVLAAAAFGIVAAVPPGSPDNAALAQTPTPAATPAAAKTTRRYTRKRYTIAVPRTWQVVSKNVRHKGYLSSRWRARPRSKVQLRVDTTRPSRASARASAAGVRSYYRGGRVRGYRQVAYRPIKLGQRRGWEWTFDLRGVRKVDIFIRACGTGYAVLGQAPKGSFSRYRATFRRAARSLRPRCQ